MIDDVMNVLTTCWEMLGQVNIFGIPLSSIIQIIIVITAIIGVLALALKLRGGK